MLRTAGEFVVLLCLVVTIIFDDYGHLGGNEMTDIPMTEKQASVLPAVIEDAEVIRARACRMADFLRDEIAKDEAEGVVHEEWRTAMRAERLQEYQIEHYRACRLVAFLEKLAGGEA